MKVALFIPCYMDQFYPQVAVATLELLEKLGIDVYYPPEQTCCGQPMANTGFEEYSKDTYKLFLKNFKDYDYVVSPSGSCVYHVRNHFDIIPQDYLARQVRSKTYELCDFIFNILGNPELGAIYPKKVGVHHSCHGLRGLRLGTCTELSDMPRSIVEEILQKVKGIELASTTRRDECCGFGGTFAVLEQAISVKMGKDRINDFLDHDVEVITSTDMSCLMHLEGIIRRNKLPIAIKHIAEILNSSC
ncbi:(Fe-S)-binding protein [Lunatimonas salinarum]|uniref:(Fe-S)-binding protein n=1 Tax=Lunatimonas salinarum TaxID=1774590 RepID=UPI001ADF27E0|nr:(Fe-S)-binding protein [Lunatimonas salinarum]